MWPSFLVSFGWSCALRSIKRSDVSDHGWKDSWVAENVRIKWICSSILRCYKCYNHLRFIREILHRLFFFLRPPVEKAVAPITSSVPCILGSLKESREWECGLLYPPDGIVLKYCVIHIITLWTLWTLKAFHKKFSSLALRWEARQTPEKSKHCLISLWAEDLVPGQDRQGLSTTGQDRWGSAIKDSQRNAHGMAKPPVKFWTMRCRDEDYQPIRLKAHQQQYFPVLFRGASGGLENSVEPAWVNNFCCPGIESSSFTDQMRLKKPEVCAMGNPYCT